MDSRLFAFVAAITGLAFGALVIVSLNGIQENMVACWPLATVVAAGLISIGLASRPPRDE